MIADAVRAPRHVFYERLNRILARHGCDGPVDELCLYPEKQGRARLAGGIYFRAVFIGPFRGD